MAMPDCDDQREETDMLNGTLQMDTRRAKSRWPASPCQLLERALLKHTVDNSLS